MERALCCVALATMVPFAQAQSLPTVQPETIFEFKDAALPEGWVKRSDAATGAAYATVLQKPKASATDSAVPELAFAIPASRFATYHVWVRVVGQSDGADSFWSSIGGKPFAYQDTGKVRAGEGVWKKLGSVFVTPGEGTSIRLKYREAGLRFDKLIVTALPMYTPAGAGSVPSMQSAMPADPFKFTPDVLPDGPHPRLYLGNSQDRKSILATRRLASESSGTIEHRRVREAWERLTAAAAAPIPAVPSSRAECNAYGKAIEAKALSYQLDGKAANGQAAVAMMRNHLDMCAYDEPVPGKREALGTRAAGAMITLGAIVYDWCRPFITDADKDLFMRRFLEQAPMEVGFPPGRQGYLVGHGSEHQLMRDQMSAAIAFYDEEPRFYQIVAGRFFKDYVPARKNLLYKSGAFHQGVSYGLARYASDMFAAWIFRRMAGVDIFGNTGKDMLYYALYMRRPDGQLMRDGDTFESNYTPAGRYWAQPSTFMLAASYFKDPVLKREYLRQLEAAGDQGTDDLWRVLFSDLAVAPADVDLPLTKFYGAPSGYMIARTGWPDKPVEPDANVVVATMKVGHTNFANHQHLDAGHFQLYYKGGLAIDAGIYEGRNGSKPSGYGSAHDRNFHKRTIAHNAMLVFQPGETFRGAESNDGGQRYIEREPGSLDMLRNGTDRYQYGGAIRHSIEAGAAAPAYSYIKGDLKHAYSDKVAAYARSFVFLNLARTDVPAALVVFDRIRSSQANFAKRWLLHSAGEPKIDMASQTVTIRRTDNGYNGQLVNRTLLPAGVNYARYGKPGEEYLVPNTAGSAMVNYPVTPANPARNSEEAGPWRIEISPSEPRQADVMLNIMQVMDARPITRPLATSAIESAQFVGAMIENRVVLFGKDEPEVGDGATFVLPASARGLDVLVTDLKPGKWRVLKDGRALPARHSVLADDGTIYLRGQGAGTYTLRWAAR